jgi:hypothetical protein
MNEYMFHHKNFTINHGNIEKIHWGRSKWDILTNIEINKPKILPYHDVTNINEKIKECFYICCNTEKEVKFTTKLLFIKANGIGSFLSFDNSKNISTLEKSRQSDHLANDTDVYNHHILLDLIELINKNISYNKWINIWKNYQKFIKNFPYYYSFSRISLLYIKFWLKSNMIWDLLNPNSFFMFIKKEHKKIEKHFIPEIIIQKELKTLNNIKQNNIILHEINYLNLFFDQKPTGTILDNYMDEIRLYTERNINLINNYESFYGKLL